MKKSIMGSKGNSIAKKILEKRAMEEKFMNGNGIGNVKSFTTNHSTLDKK